MYKVWIGNRESEILTYNIFNESITFYGSNSNGNSSFVTKVRVPASYDTAFTEYVINAMNKIIYNHSDAEFHIYNPMFAYKIISVCPNLRKYFRNLNDYEMLKWITSKTFVREWLSSTVLVPPYALLSKAECQIGHLKALFGENNTDFVVQKDISGGGIGTYVMNECSFDSVFSAISDNSLYLVSPYLKEKTTACCHMFLDNLNVVVFPIGIQCSELIENRMIYTGTCYCDDKLFKNEINEQIHETAYRVGNRLRGIGYRGICGLDFVVSQNKVYFIEINARYLGSTFVLNNVLYSQGKPSVFELNSKCFDNKLSDVIVSDLHINLASYVKKSTRSMMCSDIINLLNETKNSKHKRFLDGLDMAETIEKNTYLYREIVPIQKNQKAK